MIIELRGATAEKFKKYLWEFRCKTGREPGPEQRAEAFFCARSSDPWEIPSWCYA